LPARDDLEGISLQPQLHAGQTLRQRPAITSHNRGNHAVRSHDWRYIRYADGSEELYDTRSDPREWHNLAANSEYEPVLAEHRRWLPETEAEMVHGSAHRILSYDVDSDTAVWEGQTVQRQDPIPE